MFLKRIINFNSIINKIKDIKYIHFIGIGGISMSGIAEILFHAGYHITGSDLVINDIIYRLNKLGIKIYNYHSSENIINTNVVVISTAIAANNPELIAAKKLRIPIIHRAEMLAELMRWYHGIVVSGTHGKTTTTSMIISIFQEQGLDPTFVNGGFIKTLSSHSHLGNSNYFIAETDESDASFLCFRPILSVVTNIEDDHLNHYKGNFKNLEHSFLKFIQKIPFYSKVILCLDDIVIRNLIPKITRNIITYGFSNDADICIKEYNQQAMTAYFLLLRKNKPEIKIKLNLPGRHNALNAAAAVTVAMEEKITDQVIIEALAKFPGTFRRFELLGFLENSEINKNYHDTIVIHDYGHHPTEINTTIQTIREGWPEKTLIMIFQPHRYSRTRDLFSKFVTVLEKVDVLLMIDTYSAGEIYIPGADSYSLYYKIRNNGKTNSIFIFNNYLLPKILFRVLSTDNLILIQGAGDINKIFCNLIKLQPIPY